MMVIEYIGNKNVCVVNHGTHHHYVTLKEAEKGEWMPKGCNE